MRTETCAKRKSPSPCLLAIPVFGRIVGYSLARFHSVSLLVLIFNSILLTHNFPTLWKRAWVISTFKLGKDPAMPSSYRPISLLDTNGKLFENILLAGILHEICERGLMRDEQFGFRARYSSSLQLARLVERIIRNLANTPILPWRSQSLRYR